MFLSVWDHPVSGPAFVALLRSSLHHEWTARLLKEFLTTQLLRRASPSSNFPGRSALRASLSSQMIGLAVARYILASNLSPRRRPRRSWLPSPRPCDITC